MTDDGQFYSTSRSSPRSRRCSPRFRCEPAWVLPGSMEGANALAEVILFTTFVLAGLAALGCARDGLLCGSLGLF